MRKIFFILYIFFSISKTYSQSVGIGTNTPNINAMLDITSNSKGILIPRTSSITRITIPSVKGLLLYDTTTNSFWFADGNTWNEIPNGKGWGINGNASINSSINFLGTSDNQPLRLRLNNKWAGELNPLTRNYSVGDSAGASYSPGIAKGNIAIGSGALKRHQFANGIVAIGDSALTVADQNAIFNTAVGSHALFSNTNGQTNTAIGYNAVASNTSSFGNTAVGALALSSVAAPGNNSNTAIGFNALRNPATSIESVAIGAGAIANAPTAISSVAIGYHSLGSNNSTNGEVSIGHNAMAGGFGDFNVAIGESALLVIAGQGNTAVGSSSIANLIFGAANVAIGSQSMLNATGGYNNTALGSGTVIGPPDYNYATAIGSESKVACSNCMALGGNTSVTRTKVGINQSTPFTDLHIVQQSDNGADKTRGIRLQRSSNTNQWRTLIDPSNNYIFEYNNGLYSYIEPVGGAFVNPSDERLKRNTKPLGSILPKLLLLQPKTYQYILGDTTSNTDLYGFLTQDVEKLFPEFVHTGQNGYKGIAYHNFGIIAIKAIQELDAKNNLQETAIIELKKMVTDLLKRLEILEKK
jgi:trimeric autotransporter adhesin